VSEVIEHKYSPLGASEINEGAPCGESVRYEPEFEQLEAELSKLESLKAEPVDWNTVVQLSSDILRDKSKDLLVAVYLCQGLLQTEGYRGLAVGLQIISDMVEKHWDGMFPAKKRLRARKVAMEWLAEKASRYIETTPPGDSDADTVILAAKTGRMLDGDLAEKMEDDAPNLMDLTRPLKQLSEAFKHQQASAAPPPAPEAQEVQATPGNAPQGESSAAAPEPAPSAPPPPPVKQSAPPPPAASKASKGKAVEASVGSVDSDADARKALRQLQDGVRKVAAFFQQSKMSDPKTYRLARTATWLTIEQLPPNKDGQTQIPAPPADRCKQMTAQFEQAQFSSLVPDIEQTLARSAFWLDGHRMVAGSLKSMGAEYAAAHETVVSELRHFLQRLPGITDLKFADGTPFADDATKMWIDAEVMAASSGGGESMSAGGGATPWSEALEEARGMAASGELDKAVRQLHLGAAQAGSVREQFYWKTALSELLIQSGNVQVATQMLEQMIARIEERQLEEWESGLVVPIYKRLLDAYQKSPVKKKGGDAVLLEKIENVYSRLCWLDPMIAMTVKGD
jgi:type VI secretion system protein VasJ